MSFKLAPFQLRRLEASFIALKLVGRERDSMELEEDTLDVLLDVRVELVLILLSIALILSLILERAGFNCFSTSLATSTLKVSLRSWVCSLSFLSNKAFSVSIVI